MTSFNISFMDTALIIGTAIFTIMVGECKYPLYVKTFLLNSHLVYANLPVLNLYESGTETSCLEIKIKIFEKVNGN